MSNGRRGSAKQRSVSTALLSASRERSLPVHGTLEEAEMLNSLPPQARRVAKQTEDEVEAAQTLEELRVLREKQLAAEEAPEAAAHGVTQGAAQGAYDSRQQTGGEQRTAAHGREKVVQQSLLASKSDKQKWSDPYEGFFPQSDFVAHRRSRLCAGIRTTTPSVASVRATTMAMSA